MERFLTREDFEALHGLDTCTLANAIEAFQVRMRNEGFTSDNSVRCVFKHFPPMLGYAVTGRIRRLGWGSPHPRRVEGSRNPHSLNGPGMGGPS